MDMVGAAVETVILATQRNIPAEGDLGLKHLHEMLDKMRDGNFSEGKMGRWLGWMQAAVVSHGVATLEDMKDINRKWSDDSRR